MQIRDEHDNTSEDYIVQDNKKTRVAVTIIIVCLAVIIGAIAISGLFLGENSWNVTFIFIYL